MRGEIQAACDLTLAVTSEDTDAIARICSQQAQRLELDAFVKASSRSNIGVNELEKVGTRALTHSGSIPLGEHSSPVLELCDLVTEGFVRDDDILQGLDIACRGSLADDVQPAEDLQAVNGYRFVKAAVGAILLDKSLDERRHR